MIKIRVDNLNTGKRVEMAKEVGEKQASKLGRLIGQTISYAWERSFDRELHFEVFVKNE